MLLLQLCDEIDEVDDNAFLVPPFEAEPKGTTTQYWTVSTAITQLEYEIQVVCPKPRHALPSWMTGCGVAKVPSSQDIATAENEYLAHRGTEIVPTSWHFVQLPLSWRKLAYAPYYYDAQDIGSAYYYKLLLDMAEKEFYSLLETGIQGGFQFPDSYVLWNELVLRARVGWEQVAKALNRMRADGYDTSSLYCPR